MALGVFKDERLANAQGLAVNPVDPLPLLILDPEVVAKRQDLLPHLIAVHTACHSSTLLSCVRLLAGATPSS
jgi:hypothetical protein